MFRTLALAIAHLKVGIRCKRTSIGIYANSLVYKLLYKLYRNGLILGHGLYKKKSIFLLKDKIIKDKLKETNRFSNITTRKRYFFLISVYFKFNVNYDNLIKNIDLISKPGHRVYFKYYDVLRAYSKGDLFILSTSEFGLLYTSDIILNNLKIGGEVLCKLEI